MIYCNFRGMIDCLNYLANTTRPDIILAVRAPSRYVDNSGRKHWWQGKHISRYLKATKCRKLTYRNSEKLELTGVSDADWAEKLDDRTSTAEVESMLLVAASQELEFLQELAYEIGIDTEKPTKKHVDNQVFITIAKITVNSQKVKHFAIKLGFIQKQ